MSAVLERAVKEKVKKIAASQKRSFNEVWLQVILERPVINSR